MAGHMPPRSLHVPTPAKPELPPSVSDKPISVKRSVNVGEHWLVADHRSVENHSFRLTSKQLDHLVATVTISAPTSSYFEILSAIVWKSLCHVREDASGLNAVTICTNGSKRKEDEFPVNGLVFSKVEADFAVGKSDVSELAMLIGDKKMVENGIMEKMVVEEDEGKGDFVVYGANLTFVDLEEAEFYEVKLNGREPILANCTFHGVGDEGVVLVLPAPEADDNTEDGGGNGRIITVALPPKELEQLKHKLEREWGIV